MRLAVAPLLLTLGCATSVPSRAPALHGKGVPHPTGASPARVAGLPRLPHATSGSLERPNRYFVEIGESIKREGNLGLEVLRVETADGPMAMKFFEDRASESPREEARIQNLFAMRGLSPAVRAFVDFAQVAELGLRHPAIKRMTGGYVSGPAIVMDLLDSPVIFKDGAFPKLDPEATRHWDPQAIAGRLEAMRETIQELDLSTMDFQIAIDRAGTAWLIDFGFYRSGASPEGAAHVDRMISDINRAIQSSRGDRE